MSGFLVDTNVLSEFSRTGEPEVRVKNWLKDTAPDSLFVSVLTLAEIRRGIEVLAVGKRRGPRPSATGRFFRRGRKRKAFSWR